MGSLENKFVLKQITKPSDDDYAEALKIYSDTTPQEIRTNSNEITYWLEKSDTDKFEMLLFMLYVDGIVVGFSQITYIISTKIAIIDYISLKDSYRLNTIFLVFLSMIQNYISATERHIAYYVAEISNKDGGNDIDRESAFYKRIVCLENFGKVESSYYNLPLGIDNYESVFDSLMYLKSNDKINTISRDTFLSIVKSICYDYYYTWYKEFLTPNESETYKNKIGIMLENIKKSITNERISISYSQCPLFVTESNEKTYGSIPNISSHKFAKWPLFLAAVVILPILITVLYMFVFSKLGIEFSTISTLVGAIFGAMLSASVAYLVAKKIS